MLDSTAALPLPPTDELVHALLEVSLNGLLLLRPVFTAADPARVADFTYVRLNPAAQQLLGLPECPTESFLTRFPRTRQTGVFTFLSEALVSDRPALLHVDYPFDGLATSFQLSAQRSGEHLLVSFLDTAPQHERSAAEHALRASQAQEHAAHAETDRQRAHLYALFEQAPAMICLLEGPEHVFEFVNPPYQALVGNRPLVGKPIAQAMPELAGQPIFDLLDQVYQTGETFRANEMLVQLDHDNVGAAQLEQRYYNFIYQARRDQHGTIDGIFVFAYEVTGLVLARQQVQALNEELAVANEELRGANEEFQAGNTELHVAQQELVLLNQELEARVAARTREARQARAEAERERRQLEKLLLRAPASICIFDGPDWVYSFVNPGYQRMFPGRQLLGLRLVDALPEVADQPLMDIMHHVYDTGETYEGKEVLVPLARTEQGPIEDIYFDLTYQARYNDEGQIDGFVTYAYDVTEQVLARRERAAQQQQLREMFEQAPIAIAIFRGPEHIFEVFNPRMGEMIGHAPDQVLGRPYFEVLPDLVQQGYRDLLAQVWHSGQTYVAQEQAAQLPHHRAGEPGYYTFSYVPLRDAEGRISSIMCVAVEVTTQVLARQQVQALNDELRANNASLAAAYQASEASAYQLKLLTDALPVLIGYLDREQRYQFANHAYKAWFNQEPAALLGRRVRDIVGEQAYKNAQPYIERALAGERLDFESRMPYREGFTKYIRTSYVPDITQGHVRGFYTLVSDITEQVLARQQVEAVNQELAATNEELSDTNQQLSRTNADLDNFIYTASHDLQAPISNIEGLLMALRQELPSEALTGAVPDLLQLMQDSTERFNRTIANLTDIVRLQKEHSWPADEVLLYQLIDEVRLDLQPLLAQTGGQLLVEVPAVTTLNFSAKNLRSIVYNLLSNALKYRHPDRPPVVRVWCELEPDLHVLHVQDNGLGLDLTKGSDKLFTMFGRLHTHVEGTGIGLHMVKKIVENAGGRITVASQLGQGSTFTVALPR